MTVDTEYPFRDVVAFTVSTDRRAEFAIWLRIPDWAQGATVELAEEVLSPATGGFYRLERVWEGTVSSVLRLPMQVELMNRPGNLYALMRGPLVYSLSLGERWVRVNEDTPGREPPHCDYEVYATSPWNYGLCLDSEMPQSGVIFEEQLHPPQP
jgi:DUF1680 family protein